MNHYSRITLVSAVLLLAACIPWDDGVLQKGAIAPSLKTKTLQEVGGDFSRMTTYRYPDERMYQLSIDEALEKKKTVVIAFATPGHCTVCDKQLQMLKSLLAKYQDNVLFLHMDQYQNPAAFITYKVRGDPWTFVIDKEKRVRFKRAGQLLYNELDAVVEQVEKAQG